jgi:hypothetical protein
MADPTALTGMSADDRQELKEAVCDAVLERTRQVVSGDREFGRIVLGDRPARKLSSAFILPRLDENGDDESSDIRIAAHGLDFRILPGSTGAIVIRPAFNVYGRVFLIFDYCSVVERTQQYSGAAPEFLEQAPIVDIETKRLRRRVEIGAVNK